MRNKKVFKLLLIASSVLISGCQKNNDVTPEDDTSTYIDVKADSFYSDKQYDFKFKYNDSFFERSAKTFDKDLASLSLGYAFTSGKKTTSRTFIESIGFSDIDDSSFDVPKSIDSIGFAIAKKEINDYVVVGVFFRSLKYGPEWGNNLTIGVEGDHLGFSLRAEEVKASLESYISERCKEKTLKLWISGYSRGGGISNLLASLILRNNSGYIRQENMFVYTFGAPNAVNEKDCVAYENVHNIVNGADIVANIPPNSYGLKRCGIDYDIYNQNMAEIMHDFDNEISVPSFVSIENQEGGTITNDKELTNYLISIISEEKEDKSKSAETRELFVTNYETAIRNMLLRMLQLSSATLNQMLSDFQKLGSSDILKIIYDNTGTKLKDFLKPYLDLDHIEYSEEVLKEDCATIIKAAFSILINPIMIFLSDKYRGNMTRIINMHYSDTYYALFLNYIK